MTITPIFSKQEIFTAFANNAAVLPNISWQTYAAMLADMGDHRTARLAYYHGVLEIRMPLGLHETINYILERIIITLTEELGLKIRGFGSTTLNREDLAAGAEPDCCFYIQNCDRIRGRKINLESDPPPDLAVEVDITSPSSRRFLIYRDLGIPEIWRYSSTGIKIYKLQSNEYLETEFSTIFPIISGKILDSFLKQPESMDDNELIRSFRDWLRQHSNQD